MNKLILLLVLTLTSPCYGQLSPPPQPINLHLSHQSSRYGNQGRIGPGMMLGGAVFIATGLLTTPTYVGGSTTERKPFYKQIRNIPILMGGIILSTGLVITITGN